MQVLVIHDDFWLARASSDVFPDAITALLAPLLALLALPARALGLLLGLLPGPGPGPGPAAAAQAQAGLGWVWVWDHWGNWCAAAKSVGACVAYTYALSRFSLARRGLFECLGYLLLAQVRTEQKSFLDGRTRARGQPGSWQLAGALHVQQANGRSRLVLVQVSGRRAQPACRSMLMRAKSPK
jgi:hypothetical protein